MQEALLKAFRGFDGLRDPAAAGAWLTAILLNCARDRFRRASHAVDETPVNDLEQFSLYRRIAEEDPFPY